MLKKGYKKNCRGKNTWGFNKKKAEDDWRNSELDQYGRDGLYTAESSTAGHARSWWCQCLGRGVRLAALQTPTMAPRSYSCPLFLTNLPAWSPKNLTILCNEFCLSYGRIFFFFLSFCSRRRKLSYFGKVFLFGDSAIFWSWRSPSQ